MYYFKLNQTKVILQRYIFLQLWHILMDFFQQLDPHQTFDQIDIDTQGETITLNNVTLAESMHRLQEILDQMHESKFFKGVKVHFGAKTRENSDYLDEYYHQKLKYLNLSLEEEKTYLKGIVSAQSEEDLQIKQLQHRQNQLIIKQRVEGVANPNYFPCIYIEADKKGPLFGTIQQDINRHGAGTLSAQIGYRSPIKKYDHFQFNFQWPLQTKFNKRYYQLGLSWNNPIKNLGDFFIRYNLGNDPTYQNIDTHSNGFSWGLGKGSQRYEIEWSRRVPFIHKNVQHEVYKDYFHPSSKFSLKYSKIFHNSIQHNSVTQGSFSQMKSELGLPFLGASKFLRLQYIHRQFFDTFWIRNSIQNQLLRKFFWKSTIETNFSAVAQAQYGRISYLNDLLQPIDVRGFQLHKRPMASYANFKACVKFNIHNFPLLSEANIINFLYTQAGVSFLKGQSARKPFLLGSGGLGLSFNLGLAQLELLCNLAQFQNKGLRQPAGFQFRFSMND